MGELDHRKDWMPFLWKNWCFQIVVLEKPLESPLVCKEIKPVNPKGYQPWYSLEGLMLKLKLQYFGHLMGRAVSLEKTLMLGKMEGRRRRGQQRMRWLDGITYSMDRSFSKLQEEWRTGKPGVLQFIGLQRVGQDLVIEQQQQHTQTHTHNCITLLYSWNEVTTIDQLFFTKNK